MSNGTPRFFNTFGFMQHVSKIYLCVIFASLLFSGCVIQGLFSGYDTLSKEDKERVIDVSDQADILEVENYNSVYLITPENLKQAMRGYDRNVIYLWNPFCKNETCISPSIARIKAEEKGYTFWLVSTSFYNNIATIDFGIPVYGMTESVERKIVSKYIKNFVKNIGCENYDYESYIVFNESGYRYLNDIEDL